MNFKKVILLLPLLFIARLSMACPACEKQQPKLFKGITHGTGPDSQWDYLIVTLILIIVLITLFYSVKWIIRPGEKSTTHIKYFILNEE
ncbi:MAG: hypothetical protein ABI390_07815 [Daejeonella sp.]